VIPPEEHGRWRVEEEFINAIRGREKVTRTRFEDGVRYMEFTEAVIRSAQSGQAVNLPL
jgi:predicted dehydrogenase